MKKITLFKLVLAALISGSATLSFSQCATDAFMDKCAGNLGSFTFIKSMNVELGKGKELQAEQSYVFSKGSNYMLIVCDENVSGNKMIVNLYDRNHKLIASSYNKSTKKHYPSFTYPCSATGVYYIESVFENDKGGCGVNILGFTKG